MTRATLGERGFSLIEVIMVIVVLGIFAPALVVMLRSAGLQNAKAERLTQATLLAQGKMDEVISEKKGRGYAFVDSVLAADPTHYDDAPLSGYGRFVTWVDSSYDGVAFKEVSVRVSAALIPDVTLRTWLTPY